jgi:hypothetical protein
MARQQKKSKMGRPATGKGTPVLVRLQPRDLAEVDKWVAEQPDSLTRPQAIRRLTKLGLSVKGKRS